MNHSYPRVPIAPGDVYSRETCTNCNQVRLRCRSGQKIYLSDKGDFVRNCPKPCVAIRPIHKQVLQLFAEGYTSKEVGRQLHISPRTVDGYCLQIREVLQARNIAHAVYLAGKRGLVG